MQGSNNWSYRTHSGGTIEKDSDLIPENIKKGIEINGVVGEAIVSYAKITDGSCLFQSNSRIDNVVSLLEICDKIRNAFRMFYDSEELTELDLSKLDTSEVTNMREMFKNCSGLNTLNLSGINTTKVTDMGYMFSGCSKLTSLDLSSFNTENVTDMNEMFSSCSLLTSLDLSSFNTENVTDMVSMFYYCQKITSLDLSSFNTENVTNMRGMFHNCRSLTSLNLSSFNTENVTTMKTTFRQCSSLTSLDVSILNTNNVTDMYEMFRGCTKLETLSEVVANKTNTTNDIILECNNLTNFGGFKNLGQGYTQKTSNVSSHKVRLDNSTKLTHDSLMNVINKLYDLNLTYDVANGGTLYTQILLIGSTNLAKLTAEEIAIATNKGWNVS